ncbi:hypothetical protein [Sphingomonas faeni]|uniref:hypothetical protein n=1 Tax=Sphingomonas faeni TaxID=185950 RepID=UPI00336043F5
MTISISGITGVGVSSLSSKVSGAAPTSDFDKILADFQKLARQTPAERAREAVLKKHNLSEDSYKSLQGPAREAIDKEIVEAVRQTLKVHGQDQARAQGVTMTAGLKFG